MKVLILAVCLAINLVYAQDKCKKALNEKDCKCLEGKLNQLFKEDFPVIEKIDACSKKEQNPAIIEKFQNRKVQLQTLRNDYQKAVKLENKCKMLANFQCELDTAKTSLENYRKKFTPDIACVGFAVLGTQSIISETLKQKC